MIVGAGDPKFAGAFRHDALSWRRAEMEDVLRRGAQRGEVCPDVPVEIVRERAPTR